MFREWKALFLEGLPIYEDEVKFIVIYYSTMTSRRSRNKKPHSFMSISSKTESYNQSFYPRTVSYLNQVPSVVFKFKMSCEFERQASLITFHSLSAGRFSI